MATIQKKTRADKLRGRQIPQTWRDLVYRSSYLSEDTYMFDIFFLQGWSLQILPSHSPRETSLFLSFISCSYGCWLKKDTSVFFFKFIYVVSLSLNPWVRCCEHRVLPISQHILSCWFLASLSSQYVFSSSLAVFLLPLWSTRLCSK